MEASSRNGRDTLANGVMSAAPTAQKVTPPRTTNPASGRSSYTNPSLTVDKSIVNELLLVCGVIGSTVDPKTQEMIPVEDCINWLQDLQRALRRDEDAFRPISLLLGQWKIVEQKLLPLVLSCRYNTPLILTIVKILVILTKPISDNAKNAAGMIIDTRRGKTEQGVIEEQIKLRDNAIAQANLLAQYKRLFVHHPSHRQKKKSSGGSTEEGGLLSVFVSLLAEPLSKTGLARTTEDHLTMELVLHLLRNLLCAGDPILKDAEKVQSSTILHQELIALFEREMVFDFFLVIGQEMENRENKQYNLLVMEILHHLLKRQDPTLVARSAAKNRSNPTRMKQKYSGNSAETTNRAQTFKTTGGGSLMNQLKKERQQMQSASGSRHSHFAGTLVSQKAGGQQRFRSMSALNKSSSRGGFKSAKPSTSAKRKTKKHQYFIGSGRSQAVHTREGVVSSNPTQMSGSLASRRSQRVLHDFCIRFMTQCYGPVMKSLKNEFRRDSSRLESDDKVVFFRLVCFFTQWWRVAINEGGLTKTMLTNNDSASGNDQQQKSIGHLIFTMDVFTFNLVFTAADSFLAHKKYKSLSQAVALYAEMMHLLNTMYNSSDSTENLMAMGLMDRLFYQSEAIDRLPNLLSSWIPGTFSREYLCDILELTHLTLKLLDINEKACKDYHIGGKKGKSRKLEQEPKDAVSRMKSSAADFDVINYLARKIFSNHTVFMFTQLLSQYNVNATHINDHVVSFFVRLCKFVVASEQDDEFQTEKVEDVTLEPMLFNLPLLAILNEILNDSTLEGDHSFDSFLKFAATVVRHFARAAERNPLLHVEALFRHPVPHKFCESSSNLYVPEEFRMIVERDMLLEQSREDDESIVEEEVPAPAEIADAEEELEFVDDDKELKKSEPQKEATSSNNNDSDDESDGSENNTMNRSVQKSKSTSIEKEIVKDLSKIEKELDEEEERWNDRRSFVPKRKLTVLGENKDEGAGRRDDASVEDFALPKKMNRLDPKRIRRAALLDDSDDEEFGNVMEKANLSSTGASARMLLEDSDED